MKVFFLKVIKSLKKYNKIIVISSDGPERVYRPGIKGRIAKYKTIYQNMKSNLVDTW